MHTVVLYCPYIMRCFECREAKLSVGFSGLSALSLKFDPWPRSVYLLLANTTVSLGAPEYTLQHCKINLTKWKLN